MYLWSKKEIEYILLQLEGLGQPFEAYRFSRNENGLCLLGKGGFACVYEVESRKNVQKKYALKVIGFGEKHVDSETFMMSVNAQKYLGSYQQNIIKIYGAKEVYVNVDDNNQVLSVLPAEEEKPDGNYLTLQFVLMEKCSPVLIYDKAGQAKMLNCLHRGGEKEILKLAYDIGKALTLAHNHNVIHRDVKLENIFYDTKGKKYKLGDFGIAKVTDNGMASTVAYTKGYGAPEIVMSVEDNYDNTADIYSFGIMLYLLLNQLKFPDSDAYRANAAKQYSQGYVVPAPTNGSEELIHIINRMCKYNPDDRYQTADEMLDELEGLYFGKGYRYKKQHRNGTVALGTVLLLAGTVVLKLSVHPELSVAPTVWLYIFLALSFFKVAQAIRGKRTIWASVALLVAGIVLMFVTGFAWWKAAFLFIMVISTGVNTGTIAGVITILNIMTLLEKYNGALPVYAGIPWVGPTLLSLGCILIYQVSVLKERDRTLMPLYFNANFFWIIMTMFYVILMMHAWTFSVEHAEITRIFPFSEFMTELTVTYEPGKIGVAGLVFMILWNIREQFLRFADKHKKKRPEE